jgi:HD-GYP domain-containing protein (c-di-GMP phosphodiesterase class II)
VRADAEADPRSTTTGSRASRFVAAALESLLNAIDANDPETGAHVRRVATYALILADAAALPDDQRRIVEHVALFHDIGKIHEAIYDIVHDGRSLGADQRIAIATHPARGARVLSPLRRFYPALPEGILAHHERWDGRGYPRGASGARIPIAARIVAIADTFDAVTYGRRYRERASVGFARDVILDGRGSQFDPEMVDLFAFPPVFHEIVVARRRMSRWKERVQRRRSSDAEEPVSDLAFRWRPGRRGGAARRG